MRVLFLADSGYGANWKIEDGQPSIETTFRSWGWDLVTASPAGRVEPCAWGRTHGMVPVRTDFRTSELSEGEVFDAVVVLPACGCEGLLRDGAALRLIRAAWKGGSVVAAFCKGARVLAAADIVRGRRMTGHLDFGDEYRAAGALYSGYADAKGKTDAPAVVVDGRLVTGMRSNLNRTRICEAIRDAAIRRASVGGASMTGASAAGATAAKAGGAPTAAAASVSRARGFLVAYSDYAYKGVPSTPLSLLAESLREFGGAAKDAPVLVCLREGAVEGEGLPRDVGTLRYAVPRAADAWPFAAKAFAAAAAEAEAEARGLDLLWLDRDSLVLGDLSRLALPEGIDLGYRPVNLRNIGSPSGLAPDAFWSRASALAMVDPDGIGRTTSYLDGAELRFYIAAGFLALRPEKRVLRSWAGLVGLFAEDPELATMRDLPQPYAVFMHQAALSLAASRVAGEGRLELPPDVMYPLNLYHNDLPERRPEPVDSVLSLRYDAVFEDPAWESLPFGARLRDWLATRVS